MKLLIDMNLSPNWVQYLADAGIEAVHWSAVGQPNAADAELMRFAAASGFTILTHDLDFGAILASSGIDNPSVVQIRADDLRPDVIGVSLIRALNQMSAELDAGALLTVDPTKVRLTLLPIRARGPSLAD
jgi:predicted nuclease of predicted toxin-antitoxin system